MPRTNGTYTLPTSNPVSSGTTIAASWANDTLSDIAQEITNSVPRDGTAGMTGQLRLTTGSFTTPGLSFNGAPTTGIYYEGGAMKITIANAVKAAFSGSLFDITPSVQTGGVVLGSAGSVGAPTYSFTAETDSGFLLESAGVVALSIGGVKNITFSSNKVETSGVINVADGTAAAPSLSFTSDPNTGVYSAGADTVGISAGGAVAATISQATLEAKGKVIAPGGTNAAVSYGFASAANTGMYTSDGSSIKFSVLGTDKLTVGATIATTAQIASSVATGTAPLSVASQTVVANLNADLLDGYNASQFAASSHTHSWDQVTNRHLAEGGSSVDANTTLYPNFLTNVNTPDGNYFHISQQFYGSVGGTAARSQVAVEYAASPPRMYCRQYYSGWSSWVRVDNAESTTQSIGTNGYQKLPGGLILQWGTFTRTGADMYVYFPLAFPNACLSVVLTDMYSGALNDSSRVESVSTSYFYTRRADSSAFNVMYQAIGY